MKMRVPNMAGGGAAFQAQMARMQQQMMQSAAQQQQAAAEHTGTVASSSVTLSSSGRPYWMELEHRKQSISLYPIYIAKEKSVAQGRRVPVKYAVARPRAQEMMDILTHVGFECILSKSKLHPKDTYKSDPCNFGRIHLLFKNPDGSPVKPDIAKTKIQLLKYLGEKIPLLKSRIQNPDPKPAPGSKEASSGKAKATACPAPAAAPAATSSSNTKKTTNNKRKPRKKGKR